MVSHFTGNQACSPVQNDNQYANNLKKGNKVEVSQKGDAVIYSLLANYLDICFLSSSLESRYV